MTHNPDPNTADPRGSETTPPSSPIVGPMSSSSDPRPPITGLSFGPHADAPAPAPRPVTARLVGMIAQAVARFDQGDGVSFDVGFTLGLDGSPSWAVVIAIKSAADIGGVLFWTGGVPNGYGVAQEGVDTLVSTVLESLRQSRSAELAGRNGSGS